MGCVHYENVEGAIMISKPFRVKVFDQFDTPITECKGDLAKLRKLMKYLHDKFE